MGYTIGENKCCSNWEHKILYFKEHFGLQVDPKSLGLLRWRGLRSSGVETVTKILSCCNHVTGV